MIPRGQRLGPPTARSSVTAYHLLIRFELSTDGCPTHADYRGGIREVQPSLWTA
jgi:hypothetical protein